MFSSTEPFFTLKTQKNNTSIQLLNSEVKKLNKLITLFIGKSAKNNLGQYLTEFPLKERLLSLGYIAQNAHLIEKKKTNKAMQALNEIGEKYGACPNAMVFRLDQLERLAREVNGLLQTISETEQNRSNKAQAVLSEKTITQLSTLKASLLVFQAELIAAMKIYLEEINTENSHIEKGLIFHFTRKVAKVFHPHGIKKITKQRFAVIEKQHPINQKFLMGNYLSSNSEFAEHYRNNHVHSFVNCIDEIGTDKDKAYLYEKGHKIPTYADKPREALSQGQTKVAQVIKSAGEITTVIKNIRQARSLQQQIDVNPQEKANYAKIGHSAGYEEPALQLDLETLDFVSNDQFDDMKAAALIEQTAENLTAEIASERETFIYLANHLAAHYFANKVKEPFATYVLQRAEEHTIALQQEKRIVHDDLAETNLSSEEITAELKRFEDFTCYHLIKNEFTNKEEAFAQAHLDLALKLHAATVSHDFQVQVQFRQIAAARVQKNPNWYECTDSWGPDIYYAHDLITAKIELQDFLQAQYRRIKNDFNFFADEKKTQKKLKVLNIALTLLGAATTFEELSDLKINLSEEKYFKQSRRYSVFCFFGASGSSSTSAAFTEVSKRVDAISQRHKM